MPSLARIRLVRPARRENMTKSLKLALLCAAVVGGLALPARAQTDPGLYATFNTTFGSFTIALDFTNAPMTVANFVGLGEGSRPWLSEDTGLVKTNPFYNGIIFHRISNSSSLSMIQGGSPRGDGTDGPGYSFPDEFTSPLTLDSGGIIAMANSGPNSNGSQFFITLGANSFLNGIHATFGRVVQGMSVVQAIGNVATDASLRPLTNIVINSVVIQRIGAAAQAFDVNAHKLPAVSWTPFRLTGLSGTNAVFDLPRVQNADYRFAVSPDLKTWTFKEVGLYLAPPPTGPLQWGLAPGAAWQFYRASKVAYVNPFPSPASVTGRSFHFNITSLPATMNLTIGNSGTGPFNLSIFGSGTMTSYSWTQQPYRAILVAFFDVMVPFQFQLAYQTATNGTFRGTAFTSPTSTPISGTFTSTTP